MPTRRKLLITAGFTPLASFCQQAPCALTPGTPAASGQDIFEAAASGNVKRATELANENPWIAKLRSSDGRTPLHYAVAGGQTEIIFFVTMKGADLSAGPESPLLAAVDFPDHVKAVEMSRTLLMNASDPNARRKDGKSALDLAIARGYNDIADLLIHRGAESNVQSKVERVYFGKRYSYDAEGRPFEPADLDGLPQDFINQFVTLAHFDAARVKRLFQLAPGLLAARATWDELAIEAAAHMGLTDLAQFFAGHGAPISTCTAALLGLRERVEALVQSDSNCLRERGAHDIPLLAYTAYGEQRVEIAEFLLKSGANVHATGLGLTTLHVAAAKGHIELAELLLAHGADVNSPGAQGGRMLTPLAMAARSKQSKMENFLKSRGGRV
jgi:ankyrin repeat protein